MSWITVLRKRDRFRVRFDNFDAQKIVQYGESEIQSLLQDSGIIRNRLKIESFISNARAYLDIQSEFGTFREFVWQFTDGVPIVNYFGSLKEISATTPVSDSMSKELRRRGFRFVGSTICYAFMQATGMVNDHVLSCWKRQSG